MTWTLLMAHDAAEETATCLTGRRRSSSECFDVKVLSQRPSKNAAAEWKRTSRIDCYRASASLTRGIDTIMGQIIEVSHIERHLGVEPGTRRAVKYLKIQVQDKRTHLGLTDRQIDVMARVTSRSLVAIPMQFRLILRESSMHRSRPPRLDRTTEDKAPRPRNRKHFTNR